MATDDSDALVSRVREALAPSYRLDRSLGVGGMATVYLAHDLKHERAVAIKVLRSELVASEGAERFLREIRVIARLTHPNILPLIDSGDIGGTPYYVMPFVEGESLRARLERIQKMPLDDALTLTTEVADALDYAHAARIVHRDIKPENILLLGGHAVIADFGIARAVGSGSSPGELLTSVGIALGTPAYMSPEQAAGNDDIDGRSDIYSLATVFFEMITGAVPFKAKSAQQLIAARFMQTAPRISSVLPEIPPHIDAAVASALSLETDDRPATAGAFARMLVGTAARGTSQTAAYTTLSDPLMPSVAVLPFTNLSADPENEFLSDGLTEEVMSALARLRTIRVAAKASSFAFKGRREDVRAIARQLNVGAVLDGSVRKAGSRVRVSAQLVDAQSGFEVWSDQFDRHTDDVFEIQADIAQAIAGALRATLLDARTSQRRAVAGATYETYLRGRYALNKRTERDLEQAATLFESAEQQDADFALAPAGLADALLMLGVYGTRRANDVMPRARAAADRALAIDPSLPEPHATLGVLRGVFDWDWPASEDAFRRAIALGPRYSTALQWYAVNHLVPLGRFVEARAAIERARALDPLSIVVATSVGVVQHLSGDAPGAILAFRHAQELDARFAMAHYFLGGALRDSGDLVASADAFRAAIAQTGGTPEMTAGLAQTLARQGDAAGAGRLRDQLTSMARERCVSWSLFAQVDAALGNVDESLASLEKAIEDRDPELVYVGVRTAYAPLAASPGFREMRQHIGV